MALNSKVSTRDTSACTRAAASDWEGDFPLVDGDWLADHLDTVRVVDVSQYLMISPLDYLLKSLSSWRWPALAKYFPCRDAFASAHIPGAVYADIVQEWSDTEEVSWVPVARQKVYDALGKLGIGPSDHIVLYARAPLRQWDHIQTGPSGVMWATRAWWTLRSVGHRRVSVLDGGYERWLSEGRDISSEQSCWKECTYSCPEFCPEVLSATRADVAHMRAVTPGKVINALLANLHREGSLGLSRRVGRIADSSSLPFDELMLSDQSRFKERSAMHSLIQKSLGISSVPEFDDDVIIYCGGGFCATTTAFALILCGKRQSSIKVYDGSLSDWGAQTNEECPMECDSCLTRHIPYWFLVTVVVFIRVMTGLLAGLLIPITRVCKMLRMHAN
eukprot:TRINITY_DN8142_c0_g1_i1.p1 TRINITY_DN8142_c0_g1~~TRINITY_DN8142_c0_g1_i1.p1  ORF type:complete len:409 (-),score=29.73 TRINITY_DN8142_c0_g1_i1:215-1381(-)